MKRWLTGWLVLLACIASGANAQDSGIVRIERLRAPPLQVATIPRLPVTAFDTSARTDHLDGATDGAGWWRVQPTASADERLFLVFHPYSARVTVLLPPDYRPQRQSVFDIGLDARYSRRALVFPLSADGPVYVGIEGARYPLQVAVRSVAAHAVSDRGHLQVLYSASGVLVGVFLVAMVFWLVLRDRVYLLYAGFMAMQQLYVLCTYGEAYALPGLRLLGSFGAPGVWFVATVSTIVSVYFLIDFGELRARTPRLSSILLWVGAYLPLILLALLVAPWVADKNWFPNLGNLLLLVANALAILCLFVAWRRGGRHAGMMLLGWVPLVVMSTARALQLSSGAALAPWLEYGMPLVLAYTAVVLMLGMADRMRAFRSERDLAQHDAERDSLTGVLNRAGIQRRLQWALAGIHDGYQPLAVLFLDIDHFKRINDEHGHAVGEEFLLVLPGVDRRRARDVAEQIRKSVELRCRQVAGLPLSMTVSIGVAESRRDDVVSDLIARADKAMYAAKRAGRNRVMTAGATAEFAAG